MDMVADAVAWVPFLSLSFTDGVYNIIRENTARNAMKFHELKVKKSCDTPVIGIY